jgi:hypothetical protein
MQLDFEPQFEVAELLGRHQEVILLQPLRDADNRAALGLPQLGLPLPAGEVFAVEQRLRFCGREREATTDETGGEQRRTCHGGFLEVEMCS